MKARIELFRIQFLYILLWTDRNLSSVFLQQGVQRPVVQHVSDILAQMRAMAAHAPVRAVGEVHREGHFVGDLLEDDVVVVVLEHGFKFQVPSSKFKVPSSLITINH